MQKHFAIVFDNFYDKISIYFTKITHCQRKYKNILIKLFRYMIHKQLQMPNSNYIIMEIFH